MANARNELSGLAISLLAGILAAACSCSCGESPSPSAAPSTAPEASSPTQRAGRAAVPPVTSTGEEPYTSAERGGLHGTILFEGEVPERFALGASERAECKHHAEVDQRANQVVVNDGKLAGVFVHLKSGFDKSAIPAAPSSSVALDQRGCMYVPRVVALQLGQKLRVSNSDPTNHNVHARPKKNGEFNKNMGIAVDPAKDALEVTFEHAEPVPFACDIHPWMGAVVHVEPHPWFAVSDEHGAFRIRDVPPGEYVVEAVHEKLGSVAGTVKVSAGKSTGFTMTLRAKK